MPTAVPPQQALSSMTMASPGRNAYIESWASSIRNAFSMSPASSIRTSSSIRTASSKRTGIVASEALSTLIEDSRELPWGQSVNGPVFNHFIGQVSANGQFVCLYPSCSELSFGRQADFRRHYEHTHVVGKLEYYCPVDGCQRSRKPRGKRTGLSFGDREDKMREHFRVVHSMRRGQQYREISGGTEEAHAAEERHDLLDIPQSEVQPTTSASIMSQASSLSTGPAATGVEALPVFVETFKEVLDKRSSNTLQSHSDFPVPDQVNDVTFNAFNLTDEQPHAHLLDDKAPSSYQHARIRSEDGSSKVVSVISKTPYVRPSHPKAHCQYCTERPEGFRGTHQLDRHVARAHPLRWKGYICIDYSPDENSLANCRDCRNQKAYSTWYNAAVHLRRAHFNSHLRGREGKSDEKRRGIGGGDRPSMDDLKQHWIREVGLDTNVAQPISPRNASTEEEDDNEVVSPPESLSQDWANQSFDLQHGKGLVPLTAFPPDGIRLGYLQLGNIDDDAYQSVKNIQGTGHKRKRGDTDVGNEGAYEVHGTDQMFETLFGLPEAEAWPTTQRLYEDPFASPSAQTPAS